MQQVGELVGNPPRESLVAAIQETIKSAPFAGAGA